MSNFNNGNNRGGFQAGEKKEPSYIAVTFMHESKFNQGELFGEIFGKTIKIQPTQSGKLLLKFHKDIANKTLGELFTEFDRKMAEYKNNNSGGGQQGGGGGAPAAPNNYNFPQNNQPVYGQQPTQQPVVNVPF